MLLFLWKNSSASPHSVPRRRKSRTRGDFPRFSIQNMSSSLDLSWRKVATVKLLSPRRKRKLTERREQEATSSILGGSRRCVAAEIFEPSQSAVPLPTFLSRGPTTWTFSQLHRKTRSGSFSQNLFYSR